MRTPSAEISTGTRVFRTLLFCLTAFLIAQFVSLDLSWPKQAFLGCLSVLIGILVNRASGSKVITLALMLISLTATLRYGWWRAQLLVDFFLDQSSNRISLDSLLMLILISAEAYTVLIMILGYMQTGVPGRFCTRVNATNWYERSHLWREERSIVQSRS